MTSPENNLSCDTAGAQIGHQQLWQATYWALALLVLLGLVLLPFQEALSQGLGRYLVVAYMALAATIVLICNMRLMRMAHRGTGAMAEKSPAIASLKSTQIGMMMHSHLRLDEAISTQLKGVVGETESAAMMLIVRVRNISDAANLLVTKLNRDNINASDKPQALEASVQQGSDAGNTVESIRNLHSGDEDMRQHNQALFDAIDSYSASLAVDVAEIFGLLQFQDVVRQRIERAEIAVTERNALFKEIAQAIDAPDTSLVNLQVKMRAVLDTYQAIEHLHAPAFNNVSAQSASVTKIELF